MTSPRIRTTILYDDICAEHDPGPHVECPERILLPHQAFTTGMAEYTLVAPEAATREDLERIHTASYITRVEEMCNRGGGRLDPDTTASADTMRAALNCGAQVRIEAFIRLTHPRGIPFSSRS